MGSPSTGATFTGVPQPDEKQACYACGGEGWIFEEVEVAETVAVLDEDQEVVDHENVIHVELEEVICPACGGSGIEPQWEEDNSPGWLRLAKGAFRFVKRVWSGR